MPPSIAHAAAAPVPPTARVMTCRTAAPTRERRCPATSLERDVIATQAMHRVTVVNAHHSHRVSSSGVRISKGIAMLLLSLLLTVPTDCGPRENPDSLSGSGAV